MKAIAISQIILIVLGVIVLGVVGYLLYVNFLAGRGQMTYEKCRAIALSYCGQCKVTEKYNSCEIIFESETAADQCKTLLGSGTVDNKKLTNFNCETLVK
jgi:hypothetical protein